ncbi:MAG: aminopeptidase P family N-terminal domain-containing protein, partial [Acidihalobacter sp.]
MTTDPLYQHDSAVVPVNTPPRHAEAWPLPFSPQEYADRLGRTKALMKAQGMEVLLVFDPANMNYLTGYDGWSFYVPQLLVVALAEPEPIWIGRGIDLNGAREALVQANWLQPGQHLTAMGSDAPYKNEIAP